MNKNELTIDELIAYVDVGIVNNSIKLPEMDNDQIVQHKPMLLRTFIDELVVL